MPPNAGFLIPLLAVSSLAWAATKEVTPVGDFSRDPYSGKETAIVETKTSPWSFTLEPYLWTLGMAGDVGIKGLPPSHVDYSPKTILQNLKWGVMGKAEARYGRWGLLGDGLFAELSASGDSSGPLYEGANVTIQQGLAQLALAYRVWEDRRGFVDLYVGARYNYLGIDLDLDQDSSGIQQVGDNASQRISDKLGAATDKLVDQTAAALTTRLSASVDAAKQAGAARLDAVQKQIQQAISQGKIADIARLQALQTQVTINLQSQVANGVAQVDAIRTQIQNDVRKTIGASVVERWADVPREVRRLEDRRELKKILNPVHREFVSLVDARVRQQLAVAKSLVAQDLQTRLVTLAKQRVSAAEKVLASTLTQAAKADRAAARQLVSTSRAQLASAKARRNDASSSVNTAGLAEQVSKAEKKLAKAISKKLEDTLPTGGGGDRWWVDPIVGVRAQVNLTRWLYLATQCDVGGFGAGSQIAWNLNGAVGVNWTRAIFTEIGYRYYYVDYTNTGFVYQVAESGIFLGAGVKF